jgi:acyl carrier protein
VHGAELLIESCARQPLQFFVSLSSIAGVFGSAAQANHSAANAYLDALATRIRKRGIDAISIDLGPVAEIGAAARAGATRRLAGKGMIALLPGEFAGLIRAVLRAEIDVNALALGMQWSEIDASLRRDPLFGDFVAAHAPAEAAASNILDLEKLRALTVIERRGALAGAIERELLDVLGFKAQQLDTAQGFTDLGVDSLGSVELRNRLQTLLNLSLPSSTLFDYPNIRSLAEHLDARLFPHTPSPPPAANDDLAHDEVVRRLQDKLAQLATWDAP